MLFLRTEWVCFKQLMVLAQKGYRSFLIVSSLYFFSLFQWRRGRILRIGYCALQWIDDLVEGDRQTLNRSPVETAEGFIKAFNGLIFDNSDLQILARSLKRLVEGEIYFNEFKASLEQVVRTLVYDHNRIQGRLVLDASSLTDHFNGLYENVLNLKLMVLESSLRSKDLPLLAKILTACSVQRDLEEDLLKGLINVPEDILNMEDQDYRLRPMDMIATRSVHYWRTREVQNIEPVINKCYEELKRLPDDRGSQMFRTYLEAMDRLQNKMSDSENPKKSLKKSLPREESPFY